ncbi:hypothetical protein ACHAW5_001765 [Stephanodiscus triporus]|uniref:Uncharacterized protein n=1 Tax=Stephanodiscus triporus TaxID=2934178 RepID=A0ABD3PAA4_9STRA
MGGRDWTNALVEGTAYGEVRIYDVRSSSRRPVSSWTSDDVDGGGGRRITALCRAGTDGDVLVVGNAIGDVRLLDLRRTSSDLGRLVGPGGSVRQLVSSPNDPNVVACVGLDRRLYTWDLGKANGGKRGIATGCAYLKQRLNCVMFCDDVDEDDDRSRAEAGNKAGGGGDIPLVTR